MKALVTTDSGPQLARIDEPDLAAKDEVKIRIHRAALCRTDLYVANGQIPTKHGLTLGHEAAGEIIKIGPEVTHLSIGDHVVIDPLRSCSNCPDCQRGQKHHCPHFKFMGIHYDGAFAEFVVLPANQVHIIPKTRCFDLAIYAEPLAATRAILEPLAETSDEAMVYGKGRIAALTSHVLSTAGIKNSISNQINSDQTYPVVIEAVQSESGLLAALSNLQSGGTLILKSRHPANLSLPLLELIQRRIQIKAVHYSPFEDALNHLLTHQNFIRSLIGNRWPLESFQEAFEEASSSEMKKTLFTFN